jgi:hypothetical protein
VLPMELPDRELGPCERPQQGPMEASVLLDTSIKMLELSTGVCISISIKLLPLYCVLYLCSLVDKLIDRIET